MRENNVPYGNELENKAEFVDGAVKSHWKSIVASDETVSIVGDIAISRFTVAGESESHGKISAVKLGALTVWLRQDGHSKPLARRAVELCRGVRPPKLGSLTHSSIIGKWNRSCGRSRIRNGPKGTVTRSPMR